MAPGTDRAAADIDQVVARLDQVIEWARTTPSRIGYFAAVYRRVTLTIRSDVASGRFPRPARIAQFDVTFAQRFFDAFDAHLAGGTPTQAWRIAFAASTRNDLSVVQQLLLGINAHIRLDLGVTASVIAPGPKIRELRPDFEAINEVLDGLVPRDRREIDHVSPRLGELDPAPIVADRLVDWWIHEVRAQAWGLAELLAPLTGSDHAAALNEADQHAAYHADRLVGPDPLLRELLEHVVAPDEDPGIPAVIEALR